MRGFSATSCQKTSHRPDVSLRGKSGQATFHTPIGIQEINMLKYFIIATASCALVGSAAAADLPHPQPVYKEAPVGKMPIGKAPIGKAPLGKAPIVTRG
jgi:hypothetical protein